MEAARSRQASSFGRVCGWVTFISLTLPTATATTDLRACLMGDFYCLFLIPYFPLLITYYYFIRNGSYSLIITYYPLLITYYILLITYYIVLILHFAYCLLLIALRRSTTLGFKV